MRRKKEIKGKRIIEDKRERGWEGKRERLDNGNENNEEITPEGVNGRRKWESNRIRSVNYNKRCVLVPADQISSTLVPHISLLPGAVICFVGGCITFSPKKALRKKKKVKKKIKNQPYQKRGRWREGWSRDEREGKKYPLRHVSGRTARASSTSSCTCSRHLEPEWQSESVIDRPCWVAVCRHLPCLTCTWCAWHVTSSLVVDVTSCSRERVTWSKSDGQIFYFNNVYTALHPSILLGLCFTQS